MDFIRGEGQQPVDRELSLRRGKDSHLLEMQEIASRVRVQPVKLDGIVDPDRSGAGRVAARRFGGVQPVEPIERALDLAMPEACLLELDLQRAAARLRITFALGERFEQIHQHVENAFLHRLLVSTRQYRPPGSASTSPSSSSSRSMEEAAAAVNPQRAWISPNEVGSKPIAFKRLR